jgi:hypothetical protein
MIHIKIVVCLHFGTNRSPILTPSRPFSLNPTAGLTASCSRPFRSSFPSASSPSSSPSPSGVSQAPAKGDRLPVRTASGRSKERERACDC